MTRVSCLLLAAWQSWPFNVSRSLQANLYLHHPTLSATALFLGCLVRSSGQMLLPRYLIEWLNNFDKTDREYSLAPPLLVP